MKRTKLGEPRYPQGNFRIVVHRIGRTRIIGKWCKGYIIVFPRSVLHRWYLFINLVLRGRGYMPHEVITGERCFIKYFNRFG